MTAPAPRVVNALSVDVEDWFQVENYGAVIARERWDGLEARVAASTGRLLDLFAACGVQATFFTLGWVAGRNPALIRRIVAEGHELASHGHRHERVAAIGPERFAADLRDARHVLEDIGGVAVTGYRAPTFSIGPRSTPWAHDILAETGHRYSSSIFPGRHEGAGAPDLPLTPFRPSASGVPEIPMTALRPAVLRGRAIPVSGGGWFRMMPYAAFARLLRAVNAAERRRGVFYVHPWEVDPGQPRPAGVPALKRFKHGVGLASTEARLGRLLHDFAWDRMDRVFAAEIAASDKAPAAAPPGLAAAA
ncbi:MAG: DUF3473 domain-containing protein [Acetobacteraceae bacterium]|nr:DUF3473 domain-containing protein [Acetobacteraceae bacterium]